MSEYGPYSLLYDIDGKYVSRHGDYLTVSLALDHSDPTTTRGHMAAADTTTLDALAHSMWRKADG